MKRITTIILIFLLMISFRIDYSVFAEGTTGSNLDYSRGKWTAGSTLQVPLQYTKVVQLTDGRLLAYNPRPARPSIPQVYDPVLDKWIALKETVNIETALALSDGRALIVDKDKSGYILYIYSPADNDVTVYSRVSDNWENVEAVGEQSGQIVFIVKTLGIQSINKSSSVNSGQILIYKGVKVIQPIRLDLKTGKWDKSEDPINIDLGPYGGFAQFNKLNDNETLVWRDKNGAIYNIETRKQKAVAPIPFNAHSPQFAGVLPDGNLLFAGGWKETTSQTADCLIYNPQTDKWNKAASLPGPKTSYANVSLPNGDIMLIGGMNNDADEHYLKTTVIYRTKEKDWIKGPNLSQSRDGGSASLLADGRVVVVGGVPSFKETSLATEVLIPSGLNYFKSNEQQKAAKWRATNRPILEKIINKYKSELLKENNYNKNSKVTIGSDESGVLFFIIDKYPGSLFLKYSNDDSVEIYLRVYDGKISNTTKNILLDYLKTKGISTNNKINNILSLPGQVQNTVIDSGNYSFSFSNVKTFDVVDDSLKISVKKR